MWVEAHLGVLGTTRKCRAPRGFDYWFSITEDVTGCGSAPAEGIGVYAGR